MKLNPTSFCGLFATVSLQVEVFFRFLNPVLPCLNEGYEGTWVLSALAEGPFVTWGCYVQGAHISNQAFPT